MKREREHQVTGRDRWAVGGMFFVNGFMMGGWVPQIPLLLPRHGIGEAVLGLLILGLGIGAVGAMLFSGRLIARWGATTCQSAFALALLPMLPLVVSAPSIWLLAILMALFGAVIGTMDVAMNAQAVAVERHLGRAIMSSSHGFWSLGGFCGAALGGALIARLGSERAALVIAAIAAVVVLTAIRNTTPAPTPPRTTGPREALLPRDARLWVLGLMTLFAMVPEGAVLDWGALYLTRDLGVGVQGSGLAFAFFAGTMAVVRFMGDAIRSRFGAVATLRASGAIGAAGLLGAALSPTPGLAVGFFAISGLGVANMVPVILSAAGNHPGVAPGTAMGTVVMVGYAGILLAPGSIGFVAEHAGFRLTYGVLALLLLVVALLAGRARAADRA